MDKQQRTAEYEREMAYVEQLRVGLSRAIYRGDCRWYNWGALTKMRRPRTWQAIPGVSKLYSLN